MPLTIILSRKRVEWTSQLKIAWAFGISHQPQPPTLNSCSTFPSLVLLSFFWLSPLFHDWLFFLYIIQKEFLKNDLKKVRGIAKSCSFHGTLTNIKIWVHFKIQRTPVIRLSHQWENNCCSCLFCHVILPVVGNHERLSEVAFSPFGYLNRGGAWCCLMELDRKHYQAFLRGYWAQ